jgi:hypothetical protein
MPILRIGMQSNADSSGGKRHQMGGTGKKNEPPKKSGDKPKKKPENIPAAAEDEDYEDGDIATPKRDRSGDDDEPL